MKIIIIFIIFILLSLNIYSKTRVLVYKGERKLVVLGHKNKVLKEYKISLGPSPIGHKQCQGDGKTPVGKYKLDWINENSSFYRSIHITYPNKKDKRAAKKLGCDPGGDIYIHGLTNGLRWLEHVHTWLDWTNGCIAIRNNEIDELISLLKIPTKIELRP